MMPYQVRYYVCPKNSPTKGDWETYGTYERLSQALHTYKRIKGEMFYLNRVRKYSEVTRFQLIQDGEVIAES